MLSIWGLIIGPGLLWGWIFYHSQRYKHPNLVLLMTLFLLGMGCGLLALILNHSVEKYTMFWPGAVESVVWGWDTKYPIYRAGFWFLVGMNEEFAKLLVLLLVAYPSRYLQEPFDGILYAAVTALGFASVENLFYLDQYGPPVLVTRSVITLPAHAFMSAPMGYYVARSKLHFNQQPHYPSQHFTWVFLLLTGWGISSFLHGLYDFWLSGNWEYLAYIQILVMGGVTIWLGYRALASSEFIPLKSVN